MSLKQKAVSGFTWTFAQLFSVQVINFIVQIVLARILLPSEFGLIAMLSIFISIGLTLMDGGFTSSLIRTTNADQSDYSTVFFINLINSIVIYLLLFFAAPYIASFYNEPILSGIIRVYTLSFIIRAFVAVQTTKLIKEMRFKLQLMMQIPSVAIGAITGIILAYSGYGVWSLVWMNLLQSFLYSAQHWIRSGWYPSLQLNWEKVKYHFGFGYKLTLSSLLDTVFNNIYNLVIGKYFSATQLGFYNRADTIQKFPTLLIFNALDRVTYPMLSSIQNDDVKLKSAYQKVMQQVIFLIAPLMIFLGVMAKPLFSFVLTDKWLPAVPFFQLLCITGILLPLQTSNLQILKVKGRSDLYLRLEVIKKSIIAVSILCFLPLGIFGLLYSQVILSLLMFYISAHFSGRMIGYSALQQTIDVLPIILLSLIVGFFIWLSKTFVIPFTNLNDFGGIVLCAGIYAGLYIYLGHLFRLKPLKEISGILLKKRNLTTKDVAALKK